MESNKPVIDSAAIADWPTLSSAVKISGDGLYFQYTINGGITSPLQGASPTTLVVRSITGSWKKEYVGGNGGFFSSDSKQFILQIGDKLHFLELGTGGDKVIEGITRFSNTGNGQWLCYEKKNDKVSVLLELSSGKSLQFSNAESWTFDKSDKVLLIKTNSAIASDHSGLKYIWLANLTTNNIWDDTANGKLSAYTVDDSGEQVLLTTGDNDNTVVWYWKRGMDKAVLRADNQSSGIEKGMTIGSPSFSQNGRWIMLKLKPAGETRKIDPNRSLVNVWSYKDQRIQPDQVVRHVESATYNAVLSVSGGAVVRLQYEGDGECTDMGDFGVLFRDNNPKPWSHPGFNFSYTLVDYRTGFKQALRKLPGYLDQSTFSLSNSGHYLVYWDVKKGHYFSYDLISRRERDLTGSIPTKVSIDNQPEFDSINFFVPIAPLAGWIGKDAMLLYDNYDIWQVDLSGGKRPINVTNGYGLKNHIKLRLVYGPEGEKSQQKTVFAKGDTLLLTAFSVPDGNNGFCRKVLGSATKPELLTMQHCSLYYTNSQDGGENDFDHGLQPLKAAQAPVWIVSKQTASETANYYSTNDFKTFRQLTDIHPERSYNWLTTELVHYKQLDGTPTQGVLYKPANFDPHKKYPVIFHYYEQMSHRLNEYPVPGLSENDINIPWFVSRGYLVFTPDIHYKIASKSGTTNGGWAYNSVVAAAHTLAQRSYVDTKHMGLQGHSFAGGETNYIVTHCHLFAAAAEAAGDSDPLSAYLTLTRFVSPLEHLSKQILFENGQGRYGATPWQRPDLYREASAVLHADKVTTPLLIMHNEKDNSIQWRQGIELYMALRRLDKKVWMLQYDNGRHSLYDPKDAMDYTVRMTQFFDHYLKGALPPKWMTEGIPARLKAIKTGYELDASGKQP